MSKDTIYRQAAIDAINRICPIDTEYDCTLLDRVDVRCVLSDLPSAQLAQDLHSACTDTISRAKAIDALSTPRGILYPIRTIEELPSAQPEIIRCKDCKHCDHWYADKGRCFLWHEDGIDVFEDGYCNYAERRTDE